MIRVRRGSLTAANPSSLPAGRAPVRAPVGHHLVCALLARPRRRGARLRLPAVLPRRRCSLRLRGGAKSRPPAPLASDRGLIGLPAPWRGPSPLLPPPSRSHATHRLCGSAETRCWRATASFPPCTQSSSVHGRRCRRSAWSRCGTPASLRPAPSPVTPTLPAPRFQRARQWLDLVPPPRLRQRAEQRRLVFPPSCARALPLRARGGQLTPALPRTGGTPRVAGAGRCGACLTRCRRLSARKVAGEGSGGERGFPLWRRQWPRWWLGLPLRQWKRRTSPQRCRHRHRRCRSDATIQSRAGWARPRRDVASSSRAQMARWTISWPTCLNANRRHERSTRHSARNRRSYAPSTTQ